MAHRSMLSLIVLLILPSIFGRKQGPHNNNNNGNSHNEKALEDLARSNLYGLKGNDTHPPSVLLWDSIETPKRISILSMYVDHGSYGSWYVPSLHDKHSVGWNRTVALGFLARPYACNIRFYGIGLESTLEGFVDGGTGYLTLSFNNTKGKKFWHGFDKNETNKLHCYYMTNKHFGSEFLDTPKTLGVAVHCPVPLDAEVGEFNVKRVMLQGYFCRPLAEYPVSVEVRLRPTNFVPPVSDKVVVSEKEEVQGTVTTAAQAQRMWIIRTGGVFNQGHRKGYRHARGHEFIHQQHQHHQQQQIQQPSNSLQPNYLPHAVCTVQTFRNGQSGYMLHLFVAYYLQLGWRVIVYDRFGMHREFLLDLLLLPGFNYHPYTVYQLAEPSKYNSGFLSKQGVDFKHFYRDEKKYGFPGRQADTADQDQDKSKTYDFCRLEYAHLDMILYIDADEFFYCPQGAADIPTQAVYQHRQMSRFRNLGTEEMRFVRIPFNGRVPIDFTGHINKTDFDFTEITYNCMKEGFGNNSILSMLGCWSSASSFDSFPKSADFAGKCPFHYNHWSCDGMRAGGRDHGPTKPRCRCKVGMEMMNYFEYRPILNRCYLLHLNVNKYRLESRKGKRLNDRGSVETPCPLVDMWRGVGKNAQEINLVWKTD